VNSHYELSQEYAMNGFPKSHSGVPGWIGRCIGFMSVLALFAGTATGQPPAGHITPNFENADFMELVQAVSAATGQSLSIRMYARG
jgi:hypothetical protein